jgi:hypothetical protein
MSRRDGSRIVDREPEFFLKTRKRDYDWCDGEMGGKA